MLFNLSACETKPQILCIYIRVYIYEYVSERLLFKKKYLYFDRHLSIYPHNNATYSNFYLLDDFLQAVVVYGIKPYVCFSQELFSCFKKFQKKGETRIISI